MFLLNYRYFFMCDIQEIVGYATHKNDAFDQVVLLVVCMSISCVCQQIYFNETSRDTRLQTCFINAITTKSYILLQKFVIKGGHRCVYMMCTATIAREKGRDNPAKARRKRCPTI